MNRYVFGITGLLCTLPAYAEATAGPPQPRRRRKAGHYVQRLVFRLYSLSNLSLALSMLPHAL